MIGTAILAATAQYEAATEISLFAESLTDVVAFKNTYIYSACTPPSAVPSIELCFCTEADFSNKTQCVPGACGRQSEVPCEKIVVQTCDCDSTFFQVQCQCNYPVNDYSCNGTSISRTQEILPSVNTRFESCKKHYASINALIWTLFAIFTFVNLIQVSFLCNT